MFSKSIKFYFLLLLFCNPSLAQLNIQFRSQLTYGTSNELANIGGYVDSTGKEYALVGCQTGLSIVDVSNPVAPLQKILIPGTNSFWREVKVWGKYAYVTTEGGSNGIQIINLGKLPGTITAADYKYWKGDGAINNLLTRAHSLHIDNGYVYINGPSGSSLFGGACLIVSLADPWNPAYLGNTQLAFTGNNRYIHDCFIRNDTLWGAHIYGGFFSVINVANKSAPVLLATQTTPGAFTHNTWLSDAGSRTLFTTDEVSNSYMTAFDVNNVGNITELDRVQLNPGSLAIVHNTHIKNNYAIVSWYKEGVAIVDVSRPDNLIITGYYDTYTQGSGSGYNGCWGVYPFLPSGNLVASDINNGLFVLTPTYVRGCYLEGFVKDSCRSIGIPNVTVTINAANITKQGRVTGVYKTGTAIPGTYSVTFSKTGYLSTTFTGIVLTNGVITKLDVILKPASTVSITAATITNSACNGDHNGAINITAAGGGTPYSWLWNDGAVVEDRTAIVAATYTVTVTDAGGCKNSAVYQVTQPTPLGLSFTSSPPSCLGANDGTITAYTNGGTSPYRYGWTNPAARSYSEIVQSMQKYLSSVTDSSKILNATGGTYTLVVTDTNNCQISGNYTLVATNNPCSLNLNLRIFIQGLYRSPSLMASVINPASQPLTADSITVLLAAATAPHSILFSNKGIIGTDGWGTFNFQGIQWNKNYYVVVRYRNGIEIWSKNPRNFSAAQASFDFTTQAMPLQNNMIR